MHRRRKVTGVACLAASLSASVALAQYAPLPGTTIPPTGAYPGTPGMYSATPGIYPQYMKENRYVVLDVGTTGTRFHVFVLNENCALVSEPVLPARVGTRLADGWAGIGGNGQDDKFREVLPNLINQKITSPPQVVVQNRNDGGLGLDPKMIHGYVAIGSAAFRRSLDGMYNETPDNDKTWCSIETTLKTMAYSAGIGATVLAQPISGVDEGEYAFIGRGGGNVVLEAGGSSVQLAWGVGKTAVSDMVGQELIWNALSDPEKDACGFAADPKPELTGNLVKQGPSVGPPLGDGTACRTAIDTLLSVRMPYIQQNAMRRFAAADALGSLTRVFSLYDNMTGNRGLPRMSLAPADLSALSLVACRLQALPPGFAPGVLGPCFSALYWESIVLRSGVRQINNPPRDPVGNPIDFLARGAAIAACQAKLRPPISALAFAAADFRSYCGASTTPYSTTPYTTAPVGTGFR